MKILFIYPNAGSQLGFNYGIAHLSAVLKEAGHQSRCDHRSNARDRRFYSFSIA